MFISNYIQENTHLQIYALIWHNMDPG
jgi:hypothetical protein